MKYVCSFAFGTAQFPDSFAVSGGGGVMWRSGIHSSHPGSVWASAFSSRWLLKERYQSRGRCFHHIFHCVDTVLPSQFPQIPSFLLCYALSSQHSLQSVAENAYELCIVLSFTVIMCMFLPLLSRPTPFQGQSTR